MESGGLTAEMMEADGQCRKAARPLPNRMMVAAGVIRLNGEFSHGHAKF
jgi:hypothetical protein